VREQGRATLRAWDDVLSLHAHALDPRSGEYKALVITFQDGRIALVSEAQDNWGGLVQWVTERLPGVPPYPEWSRQLRVLPTEALRLY
jgi:hypothetical protein